MKLYKMKCIKDPERMDECFEPDNQEEQYFVKLETEQENMQYREYVDSSLPSVNIEYHDYLVGKHYGFWAGYMTAKLGEYEEDDDIYYYIGVEEDELAIGEEYTDADGLVWERVE